MVEEKRGAREGALGEGSKKEWRDGSEVEHEDSRRTPKAQTRVSEPGLGVPGIEGRWEMGKGCGR